MCEWALLCPRLLRNFGRILGRAAWVKVACVAAAAAAAAAVADRAARTTHISERQVPGPASTATPSQSSRRAEQQEPARSASVSGRTANFRLFN